MKSLEEETRLRDIELYITQIIPSFDDIRKKRLWIPFEEIQLRDKAQETLFKKIENEEYDVFISHATEDKESFVEGLALILKESGLNVWYDNFQLQWGDNLRSSIEDGLKNSKYGIVVLSKSFLGKKKWTEHELDGLFARERLDKKIILPIWHNVSRDDILAYSPMLADRLAKRSGDDEISEIVNELKRLTGK